MKILNEEIPNEVNAHIEVCKSTSGIVGERLRRAHNELGRIMGRQINQDYMKSHPNDFTVLCLMRSGLSFGMGIADELDCTVLFLDEKNDPLWSIADPNHSNAFIANNLSYIKNKNIVLADAVLNTGKSMFMILDKIEPYVNEAIICVNVIPEDTVGKLEGRKAYTIRASKNKFVGAKVKKQKDGKGPDTGDRLFKMIIS